MKACFVSPFYPETITTADAMLDAWPLLRRLPVALAADGFDVVVLVHASAAAERVIDGARYRFIDPGPLPRRLARIVHRWKPRYGPAYYTPAWKLVRALMAERPDIVHVSGLTMDIQLAQIAWACRKRDIPLVVHFHGGEPERGRLRVVQRYNAARLDRVLVTTAEQARPWIAAGLLADRQIVEVVETSSPFNGLPRDRARLQSGMNGDPVYLSAGRLDAIKDPLTLLSGFEQIAQHQPDARLYLHYLTAELLPEVEAFLRDRPQIASRVELRGRVPLQEMEAVYASADFLLQASLREWSGLAILEAMSCGCIPIVSDIASFRKMTSDGRFGRLFPVGDANGLAQAALSVSETDRPVLARDVQEYFREHLSFDAMARQVGAVYHDVRSTRA